MGNYKSSTMRTFKTTMNPDEARWILENANPSNRLLRDDAINRYAADMKAGQWRLTHSGIAFDRDGNLVDGQHRLQAAALVAEVPFDTMVTVGLDPQTREVIDIGLRRSTTDLVFFRTGQRVSALTASTARYMLMRSDPKKKPSEGVMLDFIDTHQEAIRFATAVSTVAGITVAPVLAVIGRAFYTADRERLAQFREMLVSGIADGAGSTSVIQLRELLRQQKGSARDREMVYAKTQNVLSAYLQGKNLSKIYAAERELFPLPGERRRK